jgi:carbonic anhydrase
LRHTEEEIVLLSAENLKTYPSVVTALAEGRAVIRPWLFDMESGELLQYNQDFKEFVPLTAHTAMHHAEDTENTQRTRSDG